MPAKIVTKMIEQIVLDRIVRQIERELKADTHGKRKELLNIFNSGIWVDVTKIRESLLLKLLTHARRARDAG
jgi:uncharacterized Fe-S cluster-containing MiaB family protein